MEVYLPGWDPSEEDYANTTIDLSHAAVAHSDPVAMARRLGDRLRHIHLTDGTGSAKDEHLVPGRGTQPAAELLGHLADQGFAGHIVLEINTRKASNTEQRSRDLAESLRSCASTSWRGAARDAGATRRAGRPRAGPAAGLAGHPCRRSSPPPASCSPPTGSPVRRSVRSPRRPRVDPALVHHYFGTKDDLFLAALELQLDPREVMAPVIAGGPDGAGERLMRVFLSVWDDPEARLPLLGVMRGVFDASGQRLVRDGFLRMVLGPVGRRPRHRRARAPDAARGLAAGRAGDDPLRARRRAAGLAARRAGGGDVRPDPPALPHRPPPLNPSSSGCQERDSSEHNSSYGE